MNTLPDIEFSEELIRRFDKLGPRYTSYPTADRFHAGFTEPNYLEYLQQRATPGRQNPPLSIYIHVPFCESLCYFCGCNKIITQDHGRSVCIAAHDRAGLERLLRYCARPPFAMERLRKAGSELVYRCAKQHSEPGSLPHNKRGVKADEITLTPLELIERIAKLVPPPRTHRPATVACWHRTHP